MPNPDGSRTQEEIDDERRADEEARKRQDPASTQRMQDMEALENQRMQRLHDEMVAAGLEPGFTVGEQGTPPAPPPPAPAPEEIDTPAPPPPAPPAPAAPAPSPAPSPTPAPQALDPQLLAQLGNEPIPLEALDQVQVRVRIDGEDRLMTLHDIRRSTQLDGAAHRRLEQANQLLEQARRTAAPAAPAPNPPVGVEPKGRPGDSTPASVTEEVKGLVSALFVGDEEAASASLTKILAGVQSPAIDPSKLTQQVATNVKQQLSAEEAEREFRSAFPDIVGDPHLARAADGFYSEVVAESPQTAYADALDEAGKRTRAWMASKGIKTATEPAQGSTRQERLERKERTTGKDVRGLNRTPAQQDERVPTPSETIAEMRKQRGLE